MTTNRKPTWIELRVSPPCVGTVFVHTSKPDKPLMVTDVDEEEIQRVDVDGITKPWGTIEDWRDEYRRRTIKVIYDPQNIDKEG